MQRRQNFLYFAQNEKKIDCEFKVKIDGKKLIPSDFIKYLCIYIDCHLDWSFHTNVLSPNLSHTVGILSKLRHYLTQTKLKQS